MRGLRVAAWLAVAMAAPGPAVERAGHVVTGANGVVVSSSRPASDVGLYILRHGGNAVDAAVATAFALVPAYPLAGNLGGGGFMLVHPAPGEGRPAVFDYRETAPAAAWPTMVTREESQFTHRAVAVPGTVRGLALAHRRFGSLPWPELVRPAIALARDGFAVSRHLAESMNEVLAGAREFGEFQRVFGKPGGGPWKAGDRLVQPDLSRTLQAIADHGPDVFYEGAIADEIVGEMKRGGGLIASEDLAGYEAVEREPLAFRYRGRYDVYVPPPPSSGGVCLLEELGMLETFDLGAWGRWSAGTLHVMAEAMRRACRDRARHLGDPAFVDIPPDLTAPDYVHALARTIDVRRASRSDSLAGDIALSREGENTTHFSVIDGRGMAVSNTYTLERLWGSRIVVRGTGVLLNNDMRAFNLFPGVTDTKGTIGTAPNTIGPGKRPLSSMAPTIVAEGGRVKLVTGSPGSRAIPHTILCVLVNVLDFGMSLEEAVEAPRLSHEWFPDQIQFEAPEAFPGAVAALREMGHAVVRKGPLPQGSAHSIGAAGPGRYVGVADRRRSGAASGY
jgi:gamma-glutamyltranspeptidase/glutathione hydrolase